MNIAPIKRTRFKTNDFSERNILFIYESRGDVVNIHTYKYYIYEFVNMMDDILNELIAITILKMNCSSLKKNQRKNRDDKILNGYFIVLLCILCILIVL